MEISSIVCDYENIQYYYKMKLYYLCIILFLLVEKISIRVVRIIKNSRYEY